jgi:error-prone DNA polymerase
MTNQPNGKRPPSSVGSGGVYAELHCRSNFSFLRGASHPDELCARAAELGYAALAITDRNTLAGVVRMHVAAKEHDLRLIVGAEIVPVDVPPVLLYPMDRAGYGRLCRLITRGRLRMPKGKCHIEFADIEALAEGLLAVALPDAAAMGGEDAAIRRYRDAFGDRLYLAAGLQRTGNAQQQAAALANLSRRVRAPLVATGDVHYHVAERRCLQDVLTCIREHCTVATAGRRLLANAERHLRDLDEIARLYAALPGAVARTVEVADRCRFSLDELRYEYPEELCPPGRTPMRFLRELTWAGAKERFGDGLPTRIRRMIEHELMLIDELGYESYFLTVWDLMRFARERGILCQGRGSAANSAVCYCLGVTAVDPERIELLFERFVSRERDEPPDIDVDFEHERREEVFQYIYRKYGRERAGITAEVITYRPRSAVRDVGKALGLSNDAVDVLAKKLDWWDSSAVPVDRLREAGLDPDDFTVRCLRKLVGQILGFPRHLSQHVGGFVITRGALCEMVPIENGAMPERTFIEWDKDDIDALGILKVDCLALGMLTCLSKAFDLVNGIHSDEATERRSDEGEGRSDRVTERRGDEGGERYTSGTRVVHGDDDGEGERKNDGSDVSGSCGVAEGDGAEQDGVSGHEFVSSGREVRIDAPDPPGGGFGSVEHRGRPRTTSTDRLSAVPSCREGVVGGTANPVDPRGTARIPPESGHRHAAGERSRSRVAGIDSRIGEKGRDRESGSQHRDIDDESNDPSVGLDDSSPSLRRSPRSEASGSKTVAPSLSLHTIPPEDPAVYDMLCQADSVGVFQVESRAQMSMLPRLRPRCFYDLVIEVAIVRPGPIQGGMVHPYLRRRSGEEAITYPNAAIQEVLSKTLGVPLFQEQAMRLAVVAAGFTPGEADRLRRAMGAWRRRGVIEEFRERLIRGMTGRGLSRRFAEQTFEQVRGFGEYGFPESHAASFALLVYASAWLKRYHPAAFTAALINSQPMGFYAPAQLIRDAQAHGVEVRPIDVNLSGYDCRLEEATVFDPEASDRGERRGDEAGEEATTRRRDGLRSRGLRPRGATERIGTRPSIPPAQSSVLSPQSSSLRLGMRLVKGISRESVAGIEAARWNGSFRSVVDVARRSGAKRAILAKLAAADAFRSMGLGRRRALWDVLALREELPLFAGAFDGQSAAEAAEDVDAEVALPAMSIAERVVADYDATELSLAAHPMELVRGALNRMGAMRAAGLKTAQEGSLVRVAGLVLVRQRPSTAKGLVFVTLEDETAIANLVIRPDVYARHRPAVRACAWLVEGRVERAGDVVHVQTQRIYDLSERRVAVRPASRDFR